MNLWRAIWPEYCRYSRRFRDAARTERLQNLLALQDERANRTVFSLAVVACGMEDFGDRKDLRRHHGRKHGSGKDAESAPSEKPETFYRGHHFRATSGEWARRLPHRAHSP